MVKVKQTINSSTTGAPQRRKENNEFTLKLNTRIYDELALLSITEASKVLKVGKSRVYNLINQNKLRIINLDGVIRIPYFEIRKCLEDLSCYLMYSVKNKETATANKSIVTNPKDIMRSLKKAGEANE